MKTDITITAEQLVKSGLDLYKTQGGDANSLIASAARQLGCKTELASFVTQTVINSMNAALQRMERQAMAAANEFDTIGQMDLFQHLIPEHQIPSGMKSKYAAEVDAWMANRAEIERQNATEMHTAAERQERKSKNFERWAAATRQVVEALQEAGLDPRTVTYEQAIQQAEAFHARGGAPAGASTRRPVR